MDQIKIKSLKLEAINQVMIIQKASYHENLIEKKEIFEKILKIFPEGSLGAYISNKLCGYLFFHPFFFDKKKPLNTEFILTGKEDCIYIHDLNVHPDFRRKKIAHFLLKKCFDYSKEKKYGLISLISVQNSKKFWNKQGFEELEIMEYGNLDSVYMKKYLS